MGVMLMAEAKLSTKIGRQVNKWVRSDRFSFWPASCVLCGGNDPSGRDLCPPCAGELPYAAGACHVCGLGLSQAGVCGNCLKHPPAYDHTLAVFEYCSPVDRMVQGLKFSGRLYFGRILGQMMAECIADRCDKRPDCIVPVPLHARRLRERGFNQAQELARPVAQALGLPLDVHLCQRARSTAPQTGLDAKSRQKNLKGAFTVTRENAYRHVALLDDVMTTGSTMEALAAELKRSGVERVDVWLCARAY